MGLIQIPLKGSVTASPQTQNQALPLPQFPHSCKPAGQITSQHIGETPPAFQSLFPGMHSLFKHNSKPIKPANLCPAAWPLLRPQPASSATTSTVGIPSQDSHPADMANPLPGLSLSTLQLFTLSCILAFYLTIREAAD